MTSQIFHHDSTQAAAHFAATNAVAVLRSAIAANGSAIWVLAGGSSPMAAYSIIVNEFANAVDWSKVTALIGDERCVPFSDKDSNWGAISKILFANGPTAAMNQLAPEIDLSPEDAATRYDDMVQIIIDQGHDFDLVWLGVGEDGHTLSIFPGREELVTAAHFVMPVHDSPKPPADRISFTLAALAYASHAVIFATGAAKSDPLERAFGGEPLPIALAAGTIEQAGGNVSWVFDADARFDT